MNSSLSVIFYKKAEAPRKDWAPGVDGGVPSLEDIEGLELKMNRNPGGVELLSGELELLGLDGNVITMDEVAELLESVPELLEESVGDELGADENVRTKEEDLEEQAELDVCSEDELGLEENAIIVGRFELEEDDEGNVRTKPQDAEIRGAVVVVELELLGADENVKTKDDVSMEELLEDDFGSELELGAEENVKTKDDV